MSPQQIPDPLRIPHVRLGDAHRNGPGILTEDEGPGLPADRWLVGLQQSIDDVGHGWSAFSGALAAALEAVEDQIQPERELDIVVAAAQSTLVGDGRRQLTEAWV